MATAKTILISAVSNKRSHLVMQGMESTPAEPGAPRKRRRLTHLTPEERILRRKLKNRVAAQTARDRKKERMESLEAALAELEDENRRLREENDTLHERTGELDKENSELKSRLGMPAVVKSEERVSRPCESAVLHAPPQQGQVDTLYRLATQTMAFLLTLSLSCSLTYLSKLAMQPVSRQQLHLLRPTRRLVKMPHTRHSNREPEWWGPHQQSWNPSMN